MSFPSLNYNFLYTFFLEGYRWVMDFKATAWRRVLIAQLDSEDYFDAAFKLGLGRVAYEHQQSGGCIICVIFWHLRKLRNFCVICVIFA